MFWFRVYVTLVRFQFLNRGCGLYVKYVQYQFEIRIDTTQCSKPNDCVG